MSGGVKALRFWLCVRTVTTPRRYSCYYVDDHPRYHLCFPFIEWSPGWERSFETCLEYLVLVFSVSSCLSYFLFPSLSPLSFSLLHPLYAGTPFSSILTHHEQLDTFCNEIQPGGNGVSTLLSSGGDRIAHHAVHVLRLPSVDLRLRSYEVGGVAHL